MSTDRARALAARLRVAGFRVTASRLAILDALERDRTHPGAWEIHRALRPSHPSLSLSTVYLTLDAFAQAGLARRLPGRDGHLRVDSTCEAHDHAVCRGCGEIIDVPPRSPRRPAAPPRLPAGTVVLASRVEYDVLCPRCQAAPPEAAGPAPAHDPRRPAGVRPTHKEKD